MIVISFLHQPALANSAEELQSLIQSIAAVHGDIRKLDDHSSHGRVVFVCEYWDDRAAQLAVEKLHDSWLQGTAVKLNCRYKVSSNAAVAIRVLR